MFESSVMHANGWKACSKAAPMTPTSHGSPVSGSLGRKDACAPGDAGICMLHPATSPVDQDSHRLTFTNERNELSVWNCCRKMVWVFKKAS